MPLKGEIINLLEELVGYMELNNENKFKIRAYRNAAESLKVTDQDIEELIKSNELQNIKGIGKGILSVINEYYEKDTCSYLDELKDGIPAGVLEVMKVKGVGAQKARLLFDQLSIYDVNILEIACKENKLSELKGFGEKTQLKILEELERMKRNLGFHLLNKSIIKSEVILTNLLKNKEVRKGQLTGEIARRDVVISKLEFTFLILQIEKFIESINENFIIVSKENYKGFYKLNLDDESGYEIIFYITEEKDIYSDLSNTTLGSDAFLESEQNRTNDLGASIIPEMREQEYWNAPENLRENSNLQLENLKGLFHFHTHYSDGLNSIEEMVLAGIKRGYEYFAVCDHSKAAFYANGLKEERVFLQQKEIEDIKAKLSIDIFKGIECDILADGSLDYNEDFLNNFEFVVASVHSRFTQSEKEMTARVIKAVENPSTDILAHPTGRLLLSRNGYLVDIPKVLEACSKNSVAVEINANPHRLDLDWRHLYRARELGCKISINADAHSTKEIDNTKYGVMMARKGGVRASEVINCYDVDSFKKFINRKIKRI